MSAGRRRGEDAAGGRAKTHKSLAFQLLGDAELVAGAGFHELDVGHGIAHAHTGTGRGVELGGAGAHEAR